MSLRKFLNGHISPLTMSGAGDAAGGGGGDGGAGAPVVLSFSSDKPFAEQLPEKYRNDANFRDIKSFDGLADSFLNAQKLVGADKASLLQLPKPDADDKAWGDVWGKLGRPESADKYVIGKKADGSEYDDSAKAFQKSLLPVLHEAGLTQRQLDKIRPAWDAMASEAAGAATKAAETYAGTQQQMLKDRLGAAYDEALSDAQAAISHYGDADMVKELNIVKDGKATGDNAQVLLMFAKMGKQLREDGVIGRGGENRGGAMTPGDAQAEIGRKMADDKFITTYRNKEAPGHKEAVVEMQKLYGFAYPEPRE